CITKDLASALWPRTLGRDRHCSPRISDHVTRRCRNRAESVVRQPCGHQTARSPLTDEPGNSDLGAPVYWRTLSHGHRPPAVRRGRYWRSNSGSLFEEWSVALTSGWLAVCHSSRTSDALWPDRWGPTWKSRYQPAREVRSSRRRRSAILNFASEPAALT